MTKHIMTGPAGNSEFRSFTSGNIEGLGETELMKIIKIKTL